MGSNSITFQHLAENCGKWQKVSRQNEVRVYAYQKLRVYDSRFWVYEYRLPLEKVPLQQMPPLNRDRR